MFRIFTFQGLCALNKSGILHLARAGNTPWNAAFLQLAWNEDRIPWPKRVSLA